jgi:hypothetical protein
MHFRKLFLLGLVVFAAFFACKPNKLKVNVSKVTVDVKITRLEELMFGVEPAKLAENLTMIKRDHLNFFDIYTSFVLNIGTTNSPYFDANLDAFISDTVISRVADSVLTQFSNIDELKTDLTDGFKHYKYYFPNAQVPEIYTCMSGFTKSIFICNDGIGVGLDKYFGSDCIFYTYLGIPQYKRANMNPKKIVPDIFYSMYLSDFPYNDSLNNLLSNMIYLGKAIYFTKAMCPSMPDSIIMGYSSKQLKWCKENEDKMWTYLVERKLLYDSERLTLQKYIGDAPFTNTFSEESPGRTGSWIGYRIVNSFMDKNPKTTLSELLSMYNSQQILNRSGYFPE